MGNWGQNYTIKLNDFRDWDQDWQVELKPVECETEFLLCQQRKEMERDGGQLGVLHRVAWPGWCWETCWIGCNYGCTLNWSARWMTGYPTDQSSNQPKIHQGSGKLKQWQTSRNWGNPELDPLSRLYLHCYSQSSSTRCENRSSRFQTTSKFLWHSCPKLNQPSSRWRLKKKCKKNIFSLTGTQTKWGENWPKG